MKNGIVISGTICVDLNKFVENYPERSFSSTILNEAYKDLGGCVNNVIVNLSKLNSQIPLFAMGVIGIDENGQFLLKILKENKIDISNIEIIKDKSTSYSDIFTEIKTGCRTIFNYLGANSELGEVNYSNLIKNSSSKIVLIGYLNILDKLLENDEEFGLVSARIFKKLIENSFKTAVDLVTINSNSLEKIVKYCLKYICYLIINETEAEFLTKIAIKKNEKIDMDALKKNAEFLIKNGVRELVVIHFPEGAYAMDNNYKEYYQKAFEIKDKSMIKSSVGAGDAFCAGILFALHEDLEIELGLKIANACGMFNLFSENTTGGGKSYKELFEFVQSQNYK